MDNIGAKLKRKREEKNYSQEYVAEQLDVSPSTVSRVESDAGNVKPCIIEKYCKVLEMSIAELFAGDASPTAYTYSVTIQIGVQRIEELQKLEKVLVSMQKK